MPVGKSSIARAVTAKNAPVIKKEIAEKEACGCVADAREAEAKAQAAVKPAEVKAPRKPGRKPAAKSVQADVAAEKVQPVITEKKVAPKAQPVADGEKPAKAAPRKRAVKAHVIAQISPETVNAVRKGEETYAIGQELPRYLL